MRLKAVRTGIAVTAAATGLGLLAPTAPSVGAAPAGTPAARVSPTGGETAGRTAADKERAVIRITNRKRDAHGCNDLKMNRALRKAARRHSDKMADANSLDHQLPGEPSLSTRVENAGYTGWTMLGENLAFGLEKPSDVVAAWMGSPTHRRNILNCRYKHIGVGLEIRNGTYWWTQDFGRK